MRKKNKKQGKRPPRLFAVTESKGSRNGNETEAGKKRIILKINDCKKNREDYTEKEKKE